MKNKFPIAKIREDGTPAIWLTHENWLILESGIIKSYLDNSRSIGAEKARREKRRELGPKHQNKRIKDWDILDGMPFSKGHQESALRLFTVGFEAHGHIGDEAGINRWTPEKLVEFGNRSEQTGYDEEMKLIEAAQPKQEATA